MEEMEFLPFRPIQGVLMEEVLVHSSAGTGKSMGFGCVFIKWLREYPGLKIAVARATLTALKRTWVHTFDKLCLPMFGMSRSCFNQDKLTYFFPNGSELTIGGCDDMQKWRSWEGNVAWLVEGNEIAKGDYEEFGRGLRWDGGWGLEYNFKGIECNPSSPFVWQFEHFFGSRTPKDVLAAKAPIVAAPGRIAYQPTHKDNPAYWDAENGCWSKKGEAYRGTLSRMSGHRRRRLADGEWCAAEGQVYDNFDTARHVIQGSLEKREDGYWWVKRESGEDIKILWFAAGVDWGFKSPGCLSVWGFTGMGGTGEMILVHEAYHSLRGEDWWVERIDEAHKKFDLWRLVADNARPETIEKVNRKLVARDGHRLCVETKKGAGSVYSGVTHLHSMIGKGRVLFLKDTLAHRPDPELSSLPTCTLAELPGYSWRPPAKSAIYAEKGGAPEPDIPLDKNDHGMDAMRYLADYTFQRDMGPDEDDIDKYVAGTWGAVLEDEQIDPFAEDAA